jgi:hypothetical protein
MSRHKFNSIAPTPGHAGIFYLLWQILEPKRDPSQPSWRVTSKSCLAMRRNSGEVRRSTQKHKRLAAKSGNKLPTVVQKVYMKVG